MLPKTFQTSRLLLRPIDMGDAQAIFDGYAQDAEVSRYLTWRPHTSITHTETYVQACLNAATSRTYALVQRTTNEVIGSFDLRETGPAKLGYGYVLGSPLMGNGLDDGSSYGGCRLGARTTVNLAHWRCCRC
jgi:ribosomal-protein-alanine N-acetyltransferase